MITAVNKKDAHQYVKNFSEDVQIYLDSELKLSGRNSLQHNRDEHFKKYPNVRSEIQHLVEIDNKVIMHDKVWLNPSDKGRDIVEIFSFEDSKIFKVEVIQSKDFFN